MAVVCELWDLFAQLGIPPTKPFAKVYEQVDTEYFERLAKWDREHNEGRIFRPWKPFTHPQLGEVELGGYDARVGVWNPPYDRIADICNAQSAVFLRMACLLPRVVVEVVSVTTLDGGLSQVDLRVRNAGYFASHGLPSARGLPFSEPLRMSFAAESTEPGTPAPTLIAPAEHVVDLGHLEGWGRGRDGGDFGFGGLETRGTEGERYVRLLVRGAGELRIAVTSPRTGATELRIRVG